MSTFRKILQRRKKQQTIDKFFRKEIRQATAEQDTDSPQQKIQRTETPKSSYPLFLLKRTPLQNNNHPPSLLPPHSFPPAIKFGTGTVNETQFTVLYIFLFVFCLFCFNKYTFISYFLLRLMFVYILYTN